MPGWVGDNLGDSPVIEHMDRANNRVAQFIEEVCEALSSS